jgi:hypothetical protein
LPFVLCFNRMKPRTKSPSGLLRRAVALIGLRPAGDVAAMEQRVRELENRRSFTAAAV